MNWKRIAAREWLIIVLLLPVGGLCAYYWWFFNAPQEVRANFFDDLAAPNFHAKYAFEAFWKSHFGLNHIETAWLWQLPYLTVGIIRLTMRSIRTVLRPNEHQGLESGQNSRALFGELEKGHAGGLGRSDGFSSKDLPNESKEEAQRSANPTVGMAKRRNPCRQFHPG